MHKTKLRILPSGPPACLSWNTTLEEQVFVKTPSYDRLYEDYMIRPTSFHDMYTCAFSDVSVLVCGIEMRARGLWKCLERQQPVASRATPPILTPSHPHTHPILPTTNLLVLSDMWSSLRCYTSKLYRCCTQPSRLPQK